MTQRRRRVQAERWQAGNVNRGLTFISTGKAKKKRQPPAGDAKKKK